MVCPMGNKGPAKEAVSEYPYQSLYRPWSWALSSFFNIFLFMAMVGLLYFIYKKRKNATRSYVTYRSRVIRQRDERTDDGKKKKVALVTGGNGTLGKQLVRTLTEDGGYEVHSLDLLLPEEDNINNDVYTYIQTNILNKNDLLIAFKNVDAVFHCAGLVPNTVLHNDNEYYTINYEGTKAVVDACIECGVKRLIYTSSASVTLPKDPKQLCENCDESCPLPDVPLNPYVASKAAADKYVREFNGKNGLLTCVMRPNALMEHMYNFAQKTPYRVSGYNFELTVVSTSSAALAHMLAEKKLEEDDKGSVVAGKAYNIGEEKLSTSELAEFVDSKTGTSKTAFPISLVRPLARLNEAIYKLTGWVAISPFLTTINVNYKTHTYICERARRDLGWVQGSSWKEVVEDLIKEDKEAKKEK